MDSFVFYRSFKDTVDYFEGGERQECLYYAVECLLGDRDPHDVPYPYGAAIIQMQASVNAAKDRHEKAIEDGAKGGRPKKWIEQEEAQALYAELKNWKAVAEALDVDEDTLRKARSAWSRKTEKPKNLNVNVNDNDNVNANVNDNVIISNNKNTGSNKGTSKVPVLPELGEGERWISEPYKMRNGTWIADYEDLDGEVRCKVLGEP